jgi:hypothetical protein
MRRHLGFLVTACMTAVAPARAVPLQFDLHLDVPPVVLDSQAPAGCTVTWLIADLANKDLFAARMRIASKETDTPVNRRLPCPASVPPRVAISALDVCASRSADAKSCVYADMARGFELDPDIHNTAENQSRCSSDKASQIGVACWSAGKLEVCNVACGETPDQAVKEARARCEDKQQRACPITGSAPVAGP